MTDRELLYWLKGYLEGKGGPDNDDLLVILLKHFAETT